MAPRPARCRAVASPIPLLARWEPNARQRLQAAALDLFEQRGYEATTAADVAARAGLTERTFFRHFADKREVLFANEQAMQDALVAGVRAAPDGAALMRAGLDAVARELEPRRDDLRRRAALIASHPALREREPGKQAATAETLREALIERGAAPPAAQVAAEVAVVLLRVAFDRWLEQPGSLSEHVADALAQAETLA